MNIFVSLYIDVKILEHWRCGGDPEMEIFCGGEFYGNLTADLFQLGRFHFNNLVISMPEKTWASVVKIQNMLRITTWNHEIRITHSTAKLYTNSFQKLNFRHILSKENSTEP